MNFLCYRENRNSADNVISRRGRATRGSLLVYEDDRQTAVVFGKRAIFDHGRKSQLSRSLLLTIIRRVTLSLIFICLVMHQTAFNLGLLSLIRAKILTTYIHSSTS